DNDMSEQIIYLNGKAFRDWRTFAKELKRVLCLDDSVNVLNANVLNDVLYGGYGILSYRVPYTIVWRNFQRCKKVIPEDVLAEMCALFLDNPYITLVYE
ncbi:MAG TPA: hypothetical protein DCE42_05700, partial [Myxococcales bacterium]|nr:hypothetical protein [Myxococcales bacterium]